jgi:hypothetical protein
MIFNISSILVNQMFHFKKFLIMKEMIGVATLHEVKKMTANQTSEGNPRIVNVHCSWCTNCSGIVGD